MQFLKPLALLLAAAAPTLADFHIVHSVSKEPRGYNQYHLVAVPSNYYNCKAFFNRDRSELGSESDLDSNTYFNVKSGLCGVGQLNFYKQSDNSWKFYKNGGDGSLEGTCYPNSGRTNCGVNNYINDRLVCYSYICNP